LQKRDEIINIERLLKIIPYGKIVSFLRQLDFFLILGRFFLHALRFYEKIKVTTHVVRLKLFRLEAEGLEKAR